MILIKTPDKVENALIIIILNDNFSLFLLICFCMFKIGFENWRPCCQDKAMNRNVSISTNLKRMSKITIKFKVDRNRLWYHICHGRGRCSRLTSWETRILASTLGTGPLACLSLFPVAGFG